jgi:Dolichyl-phosphate-mannose-protein mannosyltransferase
MSIFVVSFCVRSLHAVDLEPLMYTTEQIGGGMTSEFDSRAVAILNGEGILLAAIDDRSETVVLSHAPGYSIFLSGIYATFGRNYFTVQLIQNAINSLSPVLIFLIAGNLLSWRVGAMAGVIAGFSHHLSYYSNVILSDSLCPLPILIGVYILVRTRPDERGSWKRYVAAGCMFGLAAWIRPNPMLLGVFCGVLLIAISGMRRRVLINAGLMVLASLLTIAPIPIRNYLLYRAFVPIQLGVGLNLWEGLADVSEGRFGARSDLEAMQQEIELYGDPRYGESWASPDGIMRDRGRVRRSLEVIADRPVWFVGAMFRRMAEMLKDSAFATLVFRRGDTKLRESVAAAKAAKETKRTRRQDLERQTISQSPLIIGKSLSWMRAPARTVQRLTKETGLLFALIGLAILFFGSLRRALLVMMVPLYYLLFQSVIHTEFRYTLAIRYFFMILAAIVWTILFATAAKGLRAGLVRFRS